MRTRLKTEFYWLLGTIAVTVIIGLLIFENSLFNGRLLDLQVHDTYFIFPKMLFLTIMFVTLLASTYLIRVIYWKVNNRVVNVTLTLVLICVLTRLLIYWNWIYAYVQDSGFYLFDERTQTERISEFTVTNWILPVFVLVTIVAIGTTGYKIMRPMKGE
jgi:hypothetical protein